MKDDSDLLEFDDDAAIAFIMDYIPQHVKDKITDNEVEYFLDVIYDYYESKGLIDENSTEAAAIDEEDMLIYVMDAVKKDKVIKLTEEEVRYILDGEYQYGKSIGIYEEE